MHIWIIYRKFENAKNSELVPISKGLILSLKMFSLKEFNGLRIVPVKCVVG